MIKCENGTVQMSGTPITIMADLMSAVYAFKRGVIDDAPHDIGQSLSHMLREMLDDVLDGNIEHEEDPRKAFEAAEALNSLFDRIEKANK